MIQKVLLPLSFVFMLIIQRASAQNANSKINFSTVNEVGLLTGAKGEALMVQTINGIKKNKSFAGAGVGFDFYGYRSIPLFLDFRRELSAGKNTPFVYVDAGVDFLWLNYIQKEQLMEPSSSPGFYYNLGAGLKLSGKNHGGFIVSAGYTVKQEKYKNKSTQISPISRMQAEEDDRYNFLYRRLVIKIGFQL